MPNIPILRAGRTLLRPFSTADAPDVLNLLSDAEVTAFLPMFPLHSLAEAQSFLRNENRRLWAVCPQGTDAPAGYICVGREEPFDLGYALQRRFRGCGVITGASKAVLGYLKAEGVPYVTATHDVNNPRSGAVMRRLGMRYCYSYEEQWQPKNIPVVFRMYQLNLDGQAGRVYRGYWNRYEKHCIEAGV